MSDACKTWLKFKQLMSEIIEYILGLLEYVAVNRTILQQMLCRRAVWGGVYNKEEAPMRRWCFLFVYALCSALLRMSNTCCSVYAL